MTMPKTIGAPCGCTITINGTACEHGWNAWGPKPKRKKGGRNARIRRNGTRQRRRLSDNFAGIIADRAANLRLAKEPKPKRRPPKWMPADYHSWWQLSPAKPEPKPSEPDPKPPLNMVNFCDHCGVVIDPFHGFKHWPRVERPPAVFKLDPEPEPGIGRENAAKIEEAAARMADHNRLAGIIREWAAVGGVKLPEPEPEPIESEGRFL